MKKHIFPLISLLTAFTLIVISCQKTPVSESLNDVPEKKSVLTERSCGFTVTGTANIQICGANLGTSSCLLCDGNSATLSRPSTLLNIIAYTVPSSYRIFNASATSNYVTVKQGSTIIDSVTLSPGGTCTLNVAEGCILDLVGCGG